MNTLQLIVKQMENEDIRVYKSYVKRSGRSDSRLDLKLFEAYRKEDDPDDAFSLENYGKEGAGAFHRLKNRVITDINKSELLQLFDDPEMQPLFFLSLFKKYYYRNRFELAYRYLAKAEKKAIASEDFRILEEVYTSMLLLVREIDGLQPEEISEKISRVRDILAYKTKLEHLSALLSHRLRSSQNYSVQEDPQLTELAELAQIGINNAEWATYPLLTFQIIKAAMQPLILKGKYMDAADFLQGRIPFIVNAEVPNRRLDELRVEILIYLVNSLNASTLYGKAAEASGLLLKALEKSGEVLYNKFIYFYYQSLVNAYGELHQPEKALAILEEMNEKNVAALNPMYEVFQWINTAVCQFDLGRYQQSVKSISRLYLSKTYRNLDTALKFKIETAELIMRAEKGDWDFVESKLPKMEKEFQTISKEHKREKIIFQLLNDLSENPIMPERKQLSEVAKKLQELPAAKGQEIIDYDAWIQNKLNK